MGATSTSSSLTRARRRAAAEAAEQAATALFRLCNGSTPAEGIVRIDASLRPEGRQGPLARSLDAFEEYHRRWGATWERQALLRARPVAGDARVLGRFVAARRRGRLETCPSTMPANGRSAV